MNLPEALIRLRMGQGDAHYGGNLVAGAKILESSGTLSPQDVAKFPQALVECRFVFFEHCQVPVSCQEAEIPKAAVVRYQLSQRGISAFHESGFASIPDFFCPRYDVIEKSPHGLRQIPTAPFFDESDGAVDIDSFLYRQ